MGKLFISHSSKDENVIKKIITLLTSIGIKPDDIFCSSFEGQGVKNGQRINSEIRKEINGCSAILYFVSKNFVESTFCTQELGAACLLNDKKPFFILKTNEISDDDLSGFIDNTYKYNLINTDGMSSLCDWCSENFEITKKVALLNKAISTFLEDAKEDIKILKENKDKTDKELQKERIKILESQYDDLAPGAKRILAEIFYSEGGVGYYSLSNGTICLLQNQFFVSRVSSVSIGLYEFAFSLQPWAKDFIKKNEQVQGELKKLMKRQNKMYREIDDF